MENNQSTLSPTRISRIKAQGYFKFSDEKISRLAFGNRFAYIICSLIVAYGVATANIPVLSFMLIVAFLGVLLPNHPFDYIYNHSLRYLIGKPKLPPRSKQLKFACSVATLFLAGTIFLFYSGHFIGGYVLGCILLASATLVSTMDICIPSIIYNHFGRYGKLEPDQQNQVG